MDMSLRTRIYKRKPKDVLLFHYNSCLKRFHAANITSRSLLLDHMGIKLYWKKEFRQVTDSFKARGIIYTLLRLSAQQKEKGVIMASTGTFAYILSFYGKRFNIPVTVVIPKSSLNWRNRSKVKICETYSRVIFEGRDLKEAHKIALKKAIELDMLYLDGYDYHDIITGQATIGLEILEQVSNIDAIVLPMVFDGYGLIAGIALAIKKCNPNVKIIGVQPNDIFEPLTETGEQANFSHELNVKGYNLFQILANYRKCKLIDRVVLIKEDWMNIANAMLHARKKKDDVGAISTLLAGDNKDLIDKR